MNANTVLVFVLGKMLQPLFPAAVVAFTFAAKTATVMWSAHKNCIGI